MSLGSEVIRNYCIFQRDLFKYSTRFATHSSSAVAVSLDVNVLLPLLKLLLEACLQTPGIVEGSISLPFSFAAAIPLVISWKSYTPTGSKFLKLSFLHKY